MAIACVFDCVGMSAQQYDQIVQSLDNHGHYPAEGRLYHVASETPEGCYVVEVWDSQDSWNRFTEFLEESGEEVGARPPEPQIYSVHNILTQ